MSEIYSTIGTFVGAFLGGFLGAFFFAKRRQSSMSLGHRIFVCILFSLFLATAITVFTKKEGLAKTIAYFRSGPKTPYTMLKSFFQMPEAQANSTYAAQVKQNFLSSAPDIQNLVVDPKIEHQEIGNQQMRVIAKLQGSIKDPNNDLHLLNGEIRAYFTENGVAHLEGTCAKEGNACTKMAELFNSAETALIPLLNSDTNEGIMPKLKECANENLPIIEGAPKFIVCTFAEGYSVGFYRSTKDELKKIIGN